MTRETRIGLLVGLVFILVFGLVLGDLTGTSSRVIVHPETVLKEVRQESWLPIVEQASLDVIEPAEKPQGAVPQGLALAKEPTAVRSAPMESQRSAPIALAATETTPRRNLAPRASGPRTYVVQPNDSLAKIARSVYGPEHEHEYQRIFEANRRVLDDESVVLPGQELIVPPLAERVAGVQTSPASEGTDEPQKAVLATESQRHYREMDIEQLRRHFSAGPSVSASVTQQRRPSGRVYIVRQGDNLTKIAGQMLNDSSSSAVMRIYHANRDKLASPNLLPVGLELRIPS